MRDKPRSPAGPWRAAIVVNLATVVLVGGGWGVWKAVRDEPRDCTPAARPYSDDAVVFDPVSDRSDRPYDYGVWKHPDGRWLMDEHGIAVSFTEDGRVYGSKWCLDDLWVESGNSL